MDISLIIAVSGLVASPLSSFLAVRVNLEILKVRLNVLVDSISRMEADIKSHAKVNSMQEAEIALLRERMSMMEREMRVVKKKLKLE